MNSTAEHRMPARRLRPPRVVLTVIAALVVLVLDAVTPVGLAIWLLQVVLVWITTLWANRQQMLTVAAVCATFILVGFWLSPKDQTVTWVDRANLLLSLGTVSALTHSSLRRIATEDARRKAALELGQMFRIVSGLLPVCAWCKKIRSDAGRWESWEVYIRSHSGLEITHGMCQECAAQFNPKANEKT
jgi:hypothetical protein